MEGCQALPTQQLAVTRVAHAHAVASGQKAAGSDWEAQLLVTSTWNLQGGGQVGHFALVSEWLTPRPSIHTGDRHAAWTQAWPVATGHKQDTSCAVLGHHPAPGCVSHVLSHGAGFTQHSGVSASLWVRLLDQYH